PWRAIGEPKNGRLSTLLLGRMQIMRSNCWSGEVLLGVEFEFDGPARRSLPTITRGIRRCRKDRILRFWATASPAADAAPGEMAPGRSVARERCIGLPSCNGVVGGVVPGRA